MFFSLHSCKHKKTKYMVKDRGLSAKQFVSEENSALGQSYPSVPIQCTVLMGPLLTTVVSDAQKLRKIGFSKREGAERTQLFLSKERRKFLHELVRPQRLCKLSCGPFPHPENSSAQVPIWKGAALGKASSNSTSSQRSHGSSVAGSWEIMFEDV